MGCDIHIMTERFDGKRWINADFYTPNGKGGFDIVPIYDGRNYNLFAILANVRNDYNNIPVVSPNRGIPKDASEEVKKSFEGDDYLHSANWLTLAELKSYAHPTKYGGLMLKEDGNLVDAGEMPLSWCQGTTSKGYYFKEWSRNDNILNGIIEPLERLKKCFFWRVSGEASRNHWIRIVFCFNN